MRCPPLSPLAAEIKETAYEITQRSKMLQGGILLYRSTRAPHPLTLVGVAHGYPISLARRCIRDHWVIFPFALSSHSMDHSKIRYQTIHVFDVGAGVGVFDRLL